MDLLTFSLAAFGRRLRDVADEVFLFGGNVEVVALGSLVSWSAVVLVVHAGCVLDHLFAVIRR